MSGGRQAKNENAVAILLTLRWEVSGRSPLRTRGHCSHKSYSLRPAVMTVDENTC